jgi:predicted AAA+ superfamily ATPase
MQERKPKLIWYNELGFSHNPFSIKPAVVNDKLIGQADTVDAVRDVIRKGGMCVIEGNYGVGKTTFLKSIIRRFSGRRKVVYFSCNRLTGPLDLDKLLHERFGVVGKLLKIKSKNMILLLDEAEELSKKDFRSIKKYVKEEFFKSVVLVVYDAENLQLTKKGRHQIEKNVYPLQKLTSEEAIDLVRNRVGGLSLLSDNTIKKIYDISPLSPRTFLRNCEDVCRHVVENGHKRATRRNIKEALGRYMHKAL